MITLDPALDIERLIEWCKAQPNSLERNKAVSHLQDAGVWIERLVDEVDDQPVGVGSNAEKATGGSCNCRMEDGQIIGLSRTCPTHRDK